MKEAEMLIPAAGRFQGQVYWLSISEELSWEKVRTRDRNNCILK